ncbi:MAG: hypothetical protein ABIF01_02575 [Candidatus Micrarchaeota archaeon]
MAKANRLVEMKPNREKKKVCGPGQEFVFKLPSGQEVGRAKDIVEFIDRLKTVPLQSVLYHANGGHFSGWLEFVGESGSAARLKGLKGDGEEVRKALLARI